MKSKITYCLVVSFVITQCTYLMPRAWARNDRSTELEQTTAQQKAVPIAESKNMDHLRHSCFVRLA